MPLHENLKSLWQRLFTSVKRNDSLSDSEYEDLRRLAQILGATFHDYNMFKSALTHTSFVHENQQLDLENNERLELLGDSVLDVVITERLMMDFPQEREGKLSQLRSAMVSERSLADLALEFRLGEFLYLGKGEKRSGGAQKPSLLANTYEAVLGAFFLDRGFEPSRQMILHHFKDRFEQAKAGSLLQDFKTRLQEFVQMKRGEVPRYVLRSQRGPDHEKTFEVVLELGKTAYGVGRGRSKKEAEQEAARVTLERLRQEHPELEKSE